MRLTIATIFLALLSPFALAQQPPSEELTRGLMNLATMRQLGAALEYQRVVHGGYKIGGSAAETAVLLNVDPAQLRDPWGTPYRIELTEKGYRIAGPHDCVFANGAFVHSNRDRLAALLTAAQKSEAALATAFPRGDVYRAVTTPGGAWAWLRVNEILGDAIAKGDPTVVGIVRERITQQKMKELAQQIYDTRGSGAGRGARSQRVNDEWGTPLAVVYVDAGQHFRIVSAGADKAFDQASWTRPTATPTPNDDLVIEDTSWTRAHDLDAEVKPFLPPDLQARPTLTQQKTTVGQQLYKVGGDVVAPVAVVRGEVPYPAELDGSRKIGMAELTIDASGKVLDVKPMLGLSPTAEKAIADALRRWEFQPAMRAGQPVAVVYSMTVSLVPH